MMTDLVTVMWKEWKEILALGGAYRGRFQLIFLLGILGVLLPAQVGVEWVRTPAVVAVWGWVPLLLVGAVWWYITEFHLTRFRVYPGPFDVLDYLKDVVAGDTGHGPTVPNVAATLYRLAVAWSNGSRSASPQPGSAAFFFAAFGLGFSSIDSSSSASCR